MLHFIAKLPMRNKLLTVDYYRLLGFTVLADYGDYLLMEADGSELHFFAHPLLDPDKNYGQVYIKTSEVEVLYRRFQSAGISIHPNGPLERKPWGMLEFSLLDPDKNLLTFGEAV